MIKIFTYFQSLSFFMSLIMYSSSLFSEENQPTDCQLGLLKAIYITLDNQKEIEIRKREIEVQQGILRQRGGPFDPVLEARWSTTMSKILSTTCNPYSSDYQTLFNSQFDANVNYRSRIGTRFILSTQLMNQDLDPYSASSTVSGFNPFNFSFRVEQPLLRGYRYSLDTMEEKAQKIEVSVAWYNAIYFVTDRITNTATQYWDVVFAKKLVEIYENAIQRFLKLVEITKTLIQNQQVAPVDLNQILAQLALEKFNLFAAKQAYHTNFQNLKFAMGIGNNCLSCEGMDLQIDDFPALQDEDCLSDEACEKMMQIIKSLSERRWDIIASNLQTTAVSLRLKGSENESLPRLDLFGGVNINRYESEAFGSASTLGGTAPLTFSDTRQSDISAGIIFSSPLYNDNALGLVQQRRAEMLQSQLQTELLKEAAATNFFELWKNHCLLISQLKEVQKSIEKWQILTQAESKKLTAGFGSIFNLVSFEAELTSSWALYIDIYRQYAQNIIQFRFVTGTLLNFDEENLFKINSLIKWESL